MKIPKGNSNFERIIKDGYLYIDKTKYISSLLNSDNDYILFCRPRRWGKSLLLSTIKSLYEGKKELFKNLYVEKNGWNWNNNNILPIIYFDFSGLNLNKNTNINSLKKSINLLLEENAKKHKINISYSDDISFSFKSLIENVYEKYNKDNKGKDKGIIILIDEYDKPIVETYGYENNPDVISFFTNFFSVLKSNTFYIKKQILTGIMKFKGIGSSNAMNHLTDMTLRSEMGNIVGVTEEELNKYLSNQIKEKNINKDDLKKWYNGYSFDGINKVYNTWTLLQAISSGNIENHWVNSSSDEWILKIIDNSSHNYDFVFNKTIKNIDIGSFNIANDIEKNIHNLLFYAGYLTIEKKNGSDYDLKIPNLEIKNSITKNLKNIMEEKKGFLKLYKLFNIYLTKGNSNGILNILYKIYGTQDFFDRFTDKKDLGREKLYHLIFAIIMYFGVANKDIICIEEDKSGSGMADFVVLLEKKNICFVFELKVGKNSNFAIKQIETEKKYYLKYAGYNNIIICGIEFDSISKNINSFYMKNIKGIFVDDLITNGNDIINFINNKKYLI